jgi:hypothetical protein
MSVGVTTDQKQTKQINDLLNNKVIKETPNEYQV